EINTMPTPWALRSSTTRNRASISRPVSAAVGSSRMSRRASWERALAISTSCWRAMPSSPTGRSRSTSRPIFSSASAAMRCMARRSSMPSRLGVRPRVMFSATLSWGTRFSSWWMVAMPWRSAALTSGSWTGAPSIRIRPPSGWWMPDIVLISVDLPAPFSPRRTSTSPARTWTVTSSITVTGPKDLLTPSRVSRAGFWSVMAEHLGFRGGGLGAQAQVRGQAVLGVRGLAVQLGVQQLHGGGGHALEVLADQRQRGLQQGEGGDVVEADEGQVAGGDDPVIETFAYGAERHP